MSERMSEQALATCFRLITEAGMPAQARSIRAHIDAIEADRVLLRAALIQYGAHTYGPGMGSSCDSRTGGACTCGLEALTKFHG
jgi:hypothetical protein